MSKRKKQSNTPRYKRMNRASRLQAAKHWIPTYDGKNLVRGYSNHFAVDKLVAVKELQLLGHEIDPEYIRQLKACMLSQQKINERKKLLKKEKELLESYIDSDENFFYIAGYTSGGAPYGVTWEEYEGDLIKDICKEIFEDDIHSNIPDDDLPF